jgi:chemotaxis-related protein WspB
MLFVVFQVGDDRYALGAGQVREVLPLVRIRALPRTPPAVAGIIDLRGTPVPVIDMTALLLGPPAQRRLSTRLVIVAYPVESGGCRLLALLAEKLTDTIRRTPEAFADAGIANPRTPYIDGVTSDARGLVQRIDISRLLPPMVRDVLLKPHADWPVHVDAEPSWSAER